MLAAAVGERSAGYASDSDARTAQGHRDRPPRPAGSPATCDAANPGQWMTHCHNLCHAPQGGMMATLSYQT